MPVPGSALPQVLAAATLARLDAELVAALGPELQSPGEVRAWARR
jgi:hypothetical protein